MPLELLHLAAAGGRRRTELELGGGPRAAHVEALGVVDALALQQRNDPYKVKQLEQEARLTSELNPNFADAYSLLVSTLNDSVGRLDPPRDELAGLGSSLAALPPSQRKALLLREWRGLPYAEIAFGTYFAAI